MRRSPSANATPEKALPLAVLFKRSQPLLRLYAGIEQITALERDLADALPEYLAPHVAAGLIKESALTLFTSHHAFAARLRHLKPSLIRALQQRGWPVQTLRIRIRLQTVQAHLPRAEKEAHLSATGLAQLRELSAQLSPSPLQAAIARMVARHAGKKDEK